jgi:hypothetical protein
METEDAVDEEMNHRCVDVLVVKGENGILDPLKGIWLDGGEGLIDVEAYLDTHHGVHIVRAKLIEL